MAFFRRHRSLRLFALIAATIASVGLLAAADPTPTAAQVGLPNPVDAVKGLLSGPTQLAGKVGASALQEALEWLLGGVKATITIGLVRFLVHIDLPAGKSLLQATGPLIVIGGFFLVVGLITSVADGYREVIAGTDTGSRVIGQAVFRVVGLAVLLGAWYWIVPLAVDVANGMSGYVLADDAVGSALRRSFATEEFLKGIFPLLGLITAIALACSILTLVVMKFIMAIAFACLYVGGPALIGFAALPRVGGVALSFLGRGLIVLTLIPLAWTIVFAGWAGVSAGTFDAVAGDGGSAVTALMGPGLFLAGMVVILGVTKKLLAMATFGVPTPVPGSRLARYALTAALVRKALPAAAASTAGSGASSRANKSTTPRDTRPSQQRPQGDSQTRRHPTAPPETPASRARDLPVRSDYDAGPEQRRAERVRQAHDANAVGDIKDGIWKDRAAPAPASAAMRERVTNLRGVWQQVPKSQLDEARQHLSIGDRSAFAASAKTALENHPDDPEAAWREYRDAGVKQYAGRKLDQPQQDAVDTSLAATPGAVWSTYGRDYESYGNPAPPVRPTATPPGRYDQHLYETEGGLERFRAGAQDADAEVTRELRPGRQTPPSTPPPKNDAPPD